MPRNEIIYKNTIIYKIVCNDMSVKDFYIGSTTNFVKRKNAHKLLVNNVNNRSYNQTKYEIIRSNGGWDNWTMIEIEKYPCNDSNEARARERHWYKQLKPPLNFCKPHIVQEERKENMKNYFQNNKETIYIKLCEYRKSDKAKLQKGEYQKKYRESLKGVKHNCECGSSFAITDIGRHKKTKKHLAFINK